MKPCFLPSLQIDPRASLVYTTDRIEGLFPLEIILALETEHSDRVLAYHE